MANDVAIVIPCFDLGRTIEESLGSLRAQTRAIAEIIVVDDGSTDVQTLQVLDRLRRAGTRVLTIPHGGISAARNAGIAATSAAYVTILDADDLFEPTYVEKMAGLLDRRDDLAFVTCALQAFGGADYTWAPPLTAIEILARGGPHVSTLMRRGVWEAVGGFDADLDGYELVDFWVAALERGFAGEIIDEPLLRYRVRRGSFYTGEISKERYARFMSAIAGKHCDLVERDPLRLLEEKEAFAGELQRHHVHMQGIERDLTQGVAEAHVELDGVLRPLVGHEIERTQLGDLRRTTPLSPDWGLDRGRPLDRRYIEGFLERHRDDIRGAVLEVKDPYYTRTFGGDRVTRSDVVDIDPTNRVATIIADLAAADDIPSATYDCFILTQTLHVIYDVEAVLSHAERILKPGGVLLCTVPAVSRLADLEEDFWRFTEAGARELFAETFPPDAFEVTSYGNVMACAAFLFGLAADEVAPEMLDEHDPAFPQTIAVRAVKPAAPRRRAVRPRPSSPAAGAILMYHRIADLPLDAFGLCVPPEDFRAHMAHLARHYRPVPLEEMATPRRLPQDAVAITFDDGHITNLAVAAEILTEFEIPATFFITTDGLGEEPWWDLLERLLLGTDDLPPRLALAIAGRELDLPTRTPGERESALRRVYERLFDADVAGRTEAVKCLAEWSGMDPAPRESHRTMTAGEVRALAEIDGVTIGAHTVNHLRLARCDIEAQWQEIADSRAALERLLGRPVRTFSYPYGEATPALVRTARAAGIEVAVTVGEGPVLDDAEALLLPRYEIHGCNAAAFEEKMARISGAVELYSA